MTVSAVPRVSVCMPVYNGSAYIAEAVESVLEQTFRDFHLIVCDNCSTDNTGDIVLSFKDPRIKYVRNTENLGLVGNTNRCLELAEGEYVYIFHHDDVMLPRNLEAKVRLLDSHSEVGFVHSNLMLIDNDGRIVSENIWNKDSRRDYIKIGIFVFPEYLSYMPFGASIFIGAVLARRSCYEKIGGFNPEFPHCADSEMWMRMLLFYNVACIGEPLVKYRVHHVSTSSSWGDYKSLPYLKEHYLAVKMIFSKYSRRISNADSLKNKVYSSFGERALQLGSSAIAEGDYTNGGAFLKDSASIYPMIVKNSLFWKAAAGLLTRQWGLKLYKSLKRSHS